MEPEVIFRHFLLAQMKGLPAGFWEMCKHGPFYFLEAFKENEKENSGIKKEELLKRNSFLKQLPPESKVPHSDLFFPISVFFHQFIPFLFPTFRAESRTTLTYC